MIVLIWSNNHILSDLVARNLRHRGADVREIPLASVGDTVGAEVGDADMVIVDLDWQEPELWERAAFVRLRIPSVPLVILGDAWPTPAQLDRLRPCTYVRKPFAIDALLTAVQSVPLKAT